MSSDAEQPDKPGNDSAAEVEPSESGTVQGGERRSALGGLVGSLVVLVLILLLAAGAYYWQDKVYTPEFAALNDRVEALAVAQSSAAARVASEISAARTSAGDAMALAGRVDKQFKELSENQSELQRSLGALYERETQTSVDWILAEAEYLVLAATQRLALEQDVETALAAMRAADQRLRSADHPDLIPIRDQLIEDITALEGVSLPDVEGLAIYLAKAIEQVDKLPTKPITQTDVPFDKVRGTEYDTADWRQLARAIWTDLVSLVEVKDADLPDSVLFDPELRYFLQQNLRLELASARLAVLRRDRANLQASANLVTHLIDAYYDKADAGVANLVKRLDEAVTIELSPDLPGITGSLDAIRQYRISRATAAGSAQ